MIPGDLASVYGVLEPSLKRVEESVNGLIRVATIDLNTLSIASRLKSAESIYQKLQTGRYASVRALDDLVGMTVVMRTRSAVSAAIEAVKASPLQLIREHGSTVVSPSDFKYREPKLIVAPPPGFVNRHPELVGLFVEVQFTTALQHALDVATHDFDYKGRDYEWGKFRLVAQLRGMLELVDNMIDNLEESAPLASQAADVPEAFEVATQLLGVLHNHFLADDLPSDIRRLVDTARQWLKAAEWLPADLDEALRVESDLVLWRSLSVADRLLATISRSRVAALIENMDGYFFVSRELLDACSECAEIPTDRRVTLRGHSGSEETLSITNIE